MESYGKSIVAFLHRSLQLHPLVMIVGSMTALYFPAKNFYFARHLSNEFDFSVSVFHRYAEHLQVYKSGLVA